MTHIISFQAKELHFLINSTGESGETAVCAYDTMTGDDNGNRIVTDGAANRLGRHDFMTFGTDFLRNFSVSGYPSIRDFGQDFPYRKAKRTSLWRKRRGERRIIPAKINREPLFCLLKNGKILFNSIFLQSGGKIFLIRKPQTGDVFAVTGKCKLTYWRIEGGKVFHKITFFTDSCQF